MGLLAKPIVDLAAGIAEHHDIARIQAKLESAGWIYRGDAGDDGGHVFVLEARPWQRIAHLHVVDAHGGQWRDYLRLRDLLRGNADACRAYEAVKVQLVEELGDDRTLYTNGKSAIVRSLLREVGWAVTVTDPVTLSDDVVVLRPWIGADASVMTTASRDRHRPPRPRDSVPWTSRAQRGWQCCCRSGPLARSPLPES